MSATPLNNILMGVITRPHGVRGQVCIKSFCEDPGGLGGFHTFQNATGDKIFEITITGQTAGLIIATIRGISSREEAELLRGEELFIQRAALPEVEEGEGYYYVDLMGIQAYDENNTYIGDVVQVNNYGANDFLDIRHPETFAEYTVPFTNEAILEVSVDDKKICVESTFVLEHNQKK